MSNNIELEERMHSIGRRSAVLSMLRWCLREIGYNDPAVEHAKWIVEREEAISSLRDICNAFGDNDWPDSLHLSDVIDKHLARHLKGETQ